MREEKLRQIESAIVLLDLREFARIVARYALVHGGPRYSGELRALVIEEAARQAGQVALAAQRLGIARNSVYAVLRRMQTKGEKK